MLRQGNWGLKCEASQDRALKLYPDGCTGLPALQPVPWPSRSCMGREGHGHLIQAGAEETHDFHN